MNIYGISNIAIIVTSLSMAIFVLIKGYMYRATRIWSLFAFAVAIYAFGALMVSYTNNADDAIFWWKVSYVGIILIPFLFLLFNFEFLRIRNPFVIRLFGVVTAIFLAADIFCNRLFVANVKLFFTDMKFVKPVFFVYPPGPLLYVFIICSFFGWVAYAHIELIKNYRQTRGIKRDQIRYFFVATALGFAGGGASFLPCFNISFYPILNFTVALYPPIMTYAILRYRLMDITMAVTRTSIFVAVYTFVLGLPFAVGIRFKDSLVGLFGSSWWTVPLGLMAVLATVGPFIYIYVQQKTEARLLKEQKRYQQTLKEASLGMTRIRNLRKLLDLIAHIVTKTVRISYAAIYLHDRQTDEFNLQVSRDKGRSSIPKLASDNPLIVWLSYKREPLIYEEVKRKMIDLNSNLYKDLEENMRILNASIIIPSFLEDKFMGIIVLGDKISGEIYTPEDLNVFQVLASQAALAIENAQFYEDAKTMQDQVAQAEKMATIGTMADGLSHQINNRLYALSLIAGDSIDTIKMTDTANCSPEIKEMVDQISHALERIQINVIQGGEVVRGLLKYSRQSDEGREPIDLDKIIDNTLEMVQYKVKLSELDIVRDFPPNIPQIKGNMVQLEEVFFNLIDNAYDAIVERRTTLKEEGYKGRITISAREINGQLEITVEDNGMGIKDSHSKKVFTPFFTTKTSSRKGTGLGLYVIDKIITETHKGRIAFESEHKIGTRFIMELPVANGKV